MKIRNRFVSNSSTSSFIVKNIGKENITVEETLDFLISSYFIPREVIYIEGYNTSRHNTLSSLFNILNDPKQNEKMYNKLDRSGKIHTNTTNIERNLVNRMNNVIQPGETKTIDVGNGDIGGAYDFFGNKEIVAHHMMDCNKKKIKNEKIVITPYYYTGEENE